MEDFLNRRRMKKETDKKKEELGRHVADFFTNVPATNPDQNTGIQPIINVQVTLNMAGSKSSELFEQFPKVKVEQARKSDCEPHLSVKSDVDEAESVKSELVKKEDDDEGDDIDTKEFKDIIKKTVQLDGQWKYVDVKLIPQSCMDEDIQILNSDIPIQMNQDDYLQEHDIKPTAFTAVNTKQVIPANTSPNVHGASKLMEKGNFGKGSFSRITKRPIPNESSKKTFQHKSGLFSHWK